MDKELQKLEDLEWEYETAQMLERKGQLDKAEVIVSFHKYKKQLDKVVKMQQEQNKPQEEQK